MPHFNAQGDEEWVCQRGAHVCTGPSTWVKGEGNVCPACLRQPKPMPASQPLSRTQSLRDYCRVESNGLTGPALDRYINRYYGHGG